MWLDMTVDTVVAMFYLDFLCEMAHHESVDAGSGFEREGQSCAGLVLVM